MNQFKTKRKDGCGHMPPVSPTEPSRIFQITVPASLYRWMMKQPRATARKVLAKWKQRSK